MNIEISSLKEKDLQKAEILLKLAFSTFLKLPNPIEFANGAQYYKRWYNNSSFAFAAKKENNLDNELIGYVILVKWGSFAGLGPIVTHPDYWNQGIASQLMKAALAKFEEWGIKQTGLCTYANSPKHIYFYGKFGYAPRFLIALFSKFIPNTQQILKAKRYSQLSNQQQPEFLTAAYQFTDKIYAGLDLRWEIEVVNQHSLGDTLFLWENETLIGFAICHYGKVSEAQTNTCYIKFGAAKSSESFQKLVNECEIFTKTVNMESLVAGVDTACEAAYQIMLSKNYAIKSLMASMYKPNQINYSRPDTYILNDLR